MIKHSKMSNKYIILSNSPKKEPSIKNIIDLLFSIFSFKIILNYASNYLQYIIFNTLDKEILSFDKIIKIKETVLFNDFYFYFQYFYWSICNSKYKKNKKNLLLPKNVYELKELNYITETIILRYFKAFGIKKSNIVVKKIQTIFFDKMKFKTILSHLETNHNPPLSLNDSKDYIIKDSIKSKEDTDKSKKNNLGKEYYLYRKNDIISKLPIQSFVTGYSVKGINNDMFVSINLKTYIVDKYNNYLKKRYTGKHYNNSIFYLLSYYTTNGYLEEESGKFYMDIPKIVDTKLNNLYEDAFDLLGTPFSVPLHKKYFGLFPDVEQSFGSLGSFYDVEPTSGIFSIQFHLSSFFIKKTLQSVYSWIEKASQHNKEITFMLWFLNTKNNEYIRDIQKTFFPELEESKYKKETYYYLYNNKATISNASHIIYVLSNYR